MPGGSRSSTMVFGGVPEHFNLALWEALNSGAMPVSTRFVPVPGGTGAMMRALRDADVDVAIALTEGVVAAAVDPSEDVQIKIVAPYVMSPLTWGIAAGEGGPETLEQLRGLPEIRVGVSRLGSGSHLMSFLLAEREGWEPSRLRFVVCGDISGLRGSASAKGAAVEPAAHVFLWETGMIEPFVRAGELRELGRVDTPWPCFVMAARADWLDAATGGEANRGRLARVLGAGRAAVGRFLAEPGAALESIAARFMVGRPAAAAWLSRVRYASDARLPAAALSSTVDALLRLGVIGPAQAAAASAAGLVDSGVTLTEAGADDAGADLCVGDDALRAAAAVSPLRSSSTGATGRGRDGGETAAPSSPTAHGGAAGADLDPEAAAAAAAALSARRAALSRLDAYLRSLGGGGVM